MNRSPLFYPMNRGMDSDAGGAADLQTDVMRFMAILSLCLVAIFALVQSIPLDEAPQVEEETFAEDPTPALESPVEANESPLHVPPPPEPKPVRETQRQIPRNIVARPALVENQPVEAKPPVATDEKRPADPPRPGPLTESPSPAVPDEKVGFTLRFQNDSALTRLVATGEIGLYAIYGDDALRLTIDGDRPSFWSASLPRQFHEMDESTVPEAVADALGRSGHDRGGLRWAVTLPTPMSGKLNQILAVHQGGDMVIGTDGQLRLEP